MAVLRSPQTGSKVRAYQKDRFTGAKEKLVLFSADIIVLKIPIFIRLLSTITCFDWAWCLAMSAANKPTPPENILQKTPTDLKLTTTKNDKCILMLSLEKRDIFQLVLENFPATE